MGDGPGIRMASSALQSCSSLLRQTEARKTSMWGAQEAPALPPTQGITVLL